MLYVIEHLTDPVSVLKTLKSHLKPRGILWIQTSDFSQNPFDLMVVDHCSHFRMDTLALLIERAGFEIIAKAEGWIAKEIGIVAVSGVVRESRALRPGLVENNKSRVESSLSWLEGVVKQAKDLSRECTVDMFGTALAGTWLTAMLGNKIGSFVDEDSARHGKKHMGRAVLSPAEVVEGGSVYMAFPPEMAKSIAIRLQGKYPRIRFVVPQDDLHDV